MVKRYFLFPLVAGVIGLSPIFGLVPGREREAGAEQDKAKKLSLEEKLFPFYSEVDKKFSLKKEDYVLLIVGGQQKMYLVHEPMGELIVDRIYDISTGTRGFGSEGIGLTPLGIHRINGKYGDDAPFGTIFYKGVNTKRIGKITQDENDGSSPLLLTRVLWLDGCEESNRNTFSRRIRIHGTNKEGSIGKPDSEGCIRMRNEDVVELYSLVKEGTYVNIIEGF